MVSGSLLQRKNFNAFLRAYPLLFINATSDPIPIVISIENPLNDTNLALFKEKLYKNLHKQGKVMKACDFKDVAELLGTENEFSSKKCFARHNNRYIVQTYFTEGVQYVEKNQVHVYITKGRPLNFYVAKDRGEKYKLNSFHTSYHSIFKRTCPARNNKKIKLPQNTYYFIIAQRTTTFTKRIVNDPTLVRSIQTCGESQDCSKLIAHGTTIAFPNDPNNEDGVFGDEFITESNVRKRKEQIEVPENIPSKIGVTGLDSEESASYIYEDTEFECTDSVFREPKIGKTNCGCKTQPILDKKVWEKKANKKGFSETVKHTPQEYLSLSNGIPDNGLRMHPNDDTESQGSLKMDSNSLLGRKKFNAFLRATPVLFMNATNDPIPIVMNVENPLTKTHLALFKEELYKNLHKKEKVMKSCDFKDVAKLLGAGNEFSSKKFFARHNNRYIVQTYFTEGVQYVEKNQVHVYITEGRPLNFYVAKNRGEKYKLNSFHTSYHSQFTKKCMFRKRRKFKLPQNTYYFIIAPRTTIFTKKIVNAPSLARSNQTCNDSQDCSKMIEHNTTKALVQTHFTEGVQYVKKNQVHVYKTKGKPLDFYIAKNRGQKYELHSFQTSYHSQFKRIVLKKVTAVKLPQETYYFVIAPKTTTFTKRIINVRTNQTCDEDENCSNLIELDSAKAFPIDSNNDDAAFVAEFLPKPNVGRRKERNEVPESTPSKIQVTGLDSEVSSSDLHQHVKLECTESIFREANVEETECLRDSYSGRKSQPILPKKLSEKYRIGTRTNHYSMAMNPQVHVLNGTSPLVPHLNQSDETKSQGSLDESFRNREDIPIHNYSSGTKRKLCDIEVTPKRNTVETAETITASKLREIINTVLELEVTKPQEFENSIIGASRESSNSLRQPIAVTQHEVLGIRNDCQVKSYSILPGSTLDSSPNDSLAGYSLTVEHTPQVHLLNVTPTSFSHLHRNNDTESQDLLDASFEIHEDIAIHEYSYGTKRKLCEMEETPNRSTVESTEVITASELRQILRTVFENGSLHLEPEVTKPLEYENAIIGLNRDSDNTLPQPVAVTQSVVFGVRNDHQIESYNLLPGSTLEIGPNGSLIGSFTVENEDMDPYRLSYFSTDNVFIENAIFKNGSSFKTPLLIPRNLLDLNCGSATRRKEKAVMNYFFTSAFNKIEAVYNRFVKMRNIGMIGGCVPAIVQTSGSHFSGVLPEVYTEM